ncbi:hypothetical protein [Candidatus Contubernalis alkaliaceticus]|nr:hypothetical protein [Candidatus Contubernalis alkalaceticus]UNC93768.1 hypothetical protein HUE98_02560 [Candidatus Contubernalis alkalaceticus]
MNPKGALYQGEWKNGKKHGKGIITWPSGGKYMGNFEEDLRNVCTVKVYH